MIEAACPFKITHISAVLRHGGAGQLADLLPVHLSTAAVVLGIGVVGGAAVPVEESILQKQQEILH